MTLAYSRRERRRTRRAVSPAVGPEVVQVAVAGLFGSTAAPLDPLDPLDPPDPFGDPGNCVPSLGFRTRWRKAYRHQLAKRPNAMSQSTYRRYPSRESRRRTARPCCAGARAETRRSGCCLAYRGTTGRSTSCRRWEVYSSASDKRACCRCQAARPPPPDHICIGRSNTQAPQRTPHEIRVFREYFPDSFSLWRFLQFAFTALRGHFVQHSGMQWMPGWSPSRHRSSRNSQPAQTRTDAGDAAYKVPRLRTPKLGLRNGATPSASTQNDTTSFKGKRTAGPRTTAAHKLRDVSLWATPNPSPRRKPKSTPKQWETRLRPRAVRDKREAWRRRVACARRPSVSSRSAWWTE
jgi:G:T/U-mismatch repair DNA glycosylase